MVSFEIRGCEVDFAGPVAGKWLLSNSREAWLEEGDPRVYPSLEAVPAFLR